MKKAVPIRETASTRAGDAKNVYDSELRFRALVTATSTMIYRMSPDWKELRELSGEGFLENVTEPTAGWLEKYVAPEDRSTVIAAVQKAIQQQSVFELEHRIRLPDGGFAWTMSRAVPILSDFGEVIEWFGAASDITERYQTNARLQESEQAFKSLADSLPDLVWITNDRGDSHSLIDDGTNILVLQA